MEDKSNTLELIQCSNCNTIISTSPHIFAELKQIKALIVSKASVFIDSEIIMSTSSFDNYCTYQRVYCRSCHTLLGKFYKALTEKLKKLFNNYLLNTKVVELQTISLLPDNSIKILSQKKCSEIVFPKSLDHIQFEIKDYDPLALKKSLEVYDEYMIMLKTLKLAEKGVAKFTGILLRLESRMVQLENKHSEVSAILANFRKV